MESIKQLETTKKANEKLIEGARELLSKSMNIPYHQLWEYLLEVETLRLPLSGLLARAENLRSHVEAEAHEKIKGEKMSAFGREITVKAMSAEAGEFRDTVVSLVMAVEGKLDFGKARLDSISVKTTRTEER